LKIFQRARDGDSGQIEPAVAAFDALARAGEALIRASLRDLLAQLPPERFRQIHRGTIVNLDEVAAAVRDEIGRTSLTLKHRKETLAVSRVFAHLFKQM